MALARCSLPAALDGADGPTPVTGSRDFLLDGAKLNAPELFAPAFTGVITGEKISSVAASAILGEVPPLSAAVLPGEGAPTKRHACRVGGGGDPGQGRAEWRRGLSGSPNFVPSRVLEEVSPPHTPLVVAIRAAAARPRSDGAVAARPWPGDPDLMSRVRVRGLTWCGLTVW